MMTDAPSGEEAQAHGVRGVPFRDLGPTAPQHRTGPATERALKTTLAALGRVDGRPVSADLLLYSSLTHSGHNIDGLRETVRAARRALFDPTTFEPVGEEQE